MNGLVVGVAAALLGMAAHAVLLRHLRPAWRLAALPLLLLIALAILLVFSPPVELSYTATDGLVALILAFSFGFAYALIMNGVLYDSPTLALVNAIDAYGPAGMPLADFDGFVARHPFVESRLKALIAVGELVDADGELRMRGNVVRLLTIGDTYRRLRGGQPSEGG